MKSLQFAFEWLLTAAVSLTLTLGLWWLVKSSIDPLSHAPVLVVLNPLLGFGTPALVTFVIAWTVPRRAGLFLIVYVLAIGLGAITINESLMSAIPEGKDDWGAVFVSVALWSAAAGGCLGALSRGVGIAMQSLGYSGLVAIAAQTATVSTIVAILAGPTLWSIRPPSQDCYRANVDVTLAGHSFTLPVLAPFVLQRIEHQFVSFDFDNLPQLNAFCDRRAASRGPLVVTELGVFMPKLSTDDYTSSHVEPDVARKRDNFCAAVKRKSWPAPVCASTNVAPMEPMPRAVTFRGTLASRLALMGQQFQPSAENVQCRLGSNEWRCMFDEAWFDMHQSAYEQTDRTEMALPKSIGVVDLPRNNGITRFHDRAEREGFVKHTLTDGGVSNGNSWKTQYLYMELTRIRDADGRNLVYRCRVTDLNLRNALACSALHRIEPHLFVEYEFLTGEDTFLMTAESVDRRVRLMLQEFRKP